MKTIALFKFEALPPFIKPVKIFVDAVVSLYERIREDIMTFYNVCNNNLHDVFKKKGSVRENNVKINVLQLIFIFYLFVYIKRLD